MCILHHLQISICTYLGLARSSGPEPYIYAVYDRIFGEISAKISVYTTYI
jgi:hypothetical protein